MSVVGQAATGSHARCPMCHYGTVRSATGPAFIVHAASCPQRDEGPMGLRAAYVACDNIDCRKVLDPERVRVHGAKTCDDACRAAAWKQKTGYGRLRRRANGRPKASGLQLSYRKAVDALAWYFATQDPSEEDAMQRAAEVLKGALSDRQRQQLEARER